MKKKIIICSILVAAALAAIILVCFMKNSRIYNYDISEYVEIGKYKGLDYDRPRTRVTDKEVEKEITSRLASFAETEQIDNGIVKDGDMVNIGYTGKIKGKTFAGGSADSYDIVVGDGRMISGFEEGLIGKKIGETVKLNLKFPKDYSDSEVAGKNVVFDVKINYITITHIPKLNTKFVKDKTDANSVDEYKAQVKKDLEVRSKEAAQTRIKTQLWNEIIKNSKAKKYPEKELKEAEKKADEWETQNKSQATAYGLEWNEYLQNFLKTDEKGFKKKKEEYAKQIVLNEMVLYKIAEEENIKLTRDEFEAQLDKILRETGYTDKTFKEAFNMSIEKYAEQNDWEKGMLLDKVMDKVMEYGIPHDVTEKELAEKREKKRENKMPETEMSLSEK